MEVFNLSAILRLDKRDYDKGLDDAESKAYKWGSRFGKAMRVGAVAVAATATAIVGVGAALKKGISSTAEYGDKVDKMSQKIGISSDAYQKWDYVMQRAGTSIDSMKMGMKTLSKQAESGSDAFQKLGISQEEVKNMSQEELFERTVKGLADMEQGTERAALASQLLGRAGADMGALLNGGSKAIDEQMKIAVDYGMVMPAAAVKASAAFEDSVTTMKMTATGLKNKLMGELLPAATKVTDGLGLIFKGDYKEGADKISAGIEGIATKIVNALPKIAEVGGKILKSIADSIITNLPKLTEVAVQIILGLVQYLVSAAPKLAESAIKILQTLITTIINNLPQLIDAAIKIVVSLAEAIITNLPKLVAAIPKLIQALVTAIINNLPKIAVTGIKLVLQLGKAIIKSIPKLLVSVVKMALAIPKSVLKALPKMLSSGVSLVKSLWNGLKNKLSNLPSKVYGFIKKIPEKIKDAVDMLLDAGKQLVQGLWDGIKQKWEDFKSWWSDHVGGIGKETRKQLKINSPSKVFRDIGIGIPEGMALGIKEGWDLVGSAMDDMNEQITDSDYATDFGESYTSGSFDETISIALGNVIASVMGEVTEAMQNSMMTALDDVTITLDKRQFGKMTRKAVADAL